MPPREKLEMLASHGATMCLFLSITLMKDVVDALTPAYGADCPVCVVHKATCPDEKVVWGTLADIRDRVTAAGIKTQSMILAGRLLTSPDFAESRFYAPDFSARRRRPK